jgi:hypothetical protein
LWVWFFFFFFFVLLFLLLLWLTSDRLPRVSCASCVRPAVVSLLFYPLLLPHPSSPLLATPAPRSGLPLCSADGSVALWDLLGQRAAPVSQLRGHAGPVFAVAVGLCGQLVRYVWHRAGHC